jgi:hypothetical protein
MQGIPALIDTQQTKRHLPLKQSSLLFQGVSVIAFALQEALRLLIMISCFLLSLRS